MSTLLLVTVKKIFRKILGKSTPLVIESKEEQVKFIDDLIAVIHSPLANCEYGKSWNQETKNYVTDKSLANIEIYRIGGHYRELTLYILFKENVAVVNSYKIKDTPFGSIDDIAKLVVEHQKEFVLQEERDKHKEDNSKKRSKIKNLKYKAIIAKIEEIAENENFEYEMEALVSKVKLNIRLDKNEYLEISVPYSNYQEVLQEVTNAYHAILNLKQKNVPIKVKFSIYTDGMKWKKKTK